MSRAWAGGSTTAWRKLRASVLVANAYETGGRCQLHVGQHCPRHDRPCPDVCTGMATQVHHTKGKAAGDTARHLIACCRACNLHIGDPARFNPQPKPRSKW